MVFAYSVWFTFLVLTFQEGFSQSGPTQNDFTQKLDHFGEENAGFFKQRYWVSDQYVDGDVNSPIFLLLGGEAEMRPSYSGAWLDYAKYYRAKCFQLEHRYYGESRPTIEYETPSEYYKYLSTDQALADIKNFILAMKVEYQLGDRKWVLFGGSYSASLAAWARQRYPEQVHISISSSGPVEAVADFKTFYDAIWSSMNKQSPRCGDLLHEISLDYLKAGRRSELVALASQFSGYMQNGHASAVCDIVNQLSGRADLDDIIGMLNFTKFENNGVSYLGLPPPEDDETSRALMMDVSTSGNTWSWQTCNEFGWWPTSSSQSELYGSLNHVQAFVNSYCFRFGLNLQSIEDRIRRTNLKFKSKDAAFDRVFFTHGDMDPWRAAGITSSSNPRMPVIVIEGSSHCGDYYAMSPYSPNVYRAQLKILEQIGVWLREP